MFRVVVSLRVSIEYGNTLQAIKCQTPVHCCLLWCLEPLGVREIPSQLLGPGGRVCFERPTIKAHRDRQRHSTHTLKSSRVLLCGVWLCLVGP